MVSKGPKLAQLPWNFKEFLLPLFVGRIGKSMHDKINAMLVHKLLGDDQGIGTNHLVDVSNGRNHGPSLVLWKKGRSLVASSIAVTDDTENE